MMFRKVTLLLILVIIVLSYSASAFAWSKDILRDPTVQETSQFLVTITRPEGDESTFKKSYVICGNTDADNVRVEIYLKNKTTKYFEPFANTNGETYWDIGSSGFFMKEVVLPAEGANEIRIVAYKKYDYELVAGTNLQINDFTITVLNRNIRQMIENGIFKINEFLRGMFSNQ